MLFYVKMEWNFTYLFQNVWLPYAWPDSTSSRRLYGKVYACISFMYVSRNDFPLEGRKHRMILNKSPLINVLFWLQTVLDRCVTNVGNPHKKDYYVSQRIVETRSPWRSYCSIVTRNSVQTLLGYFIFFPDWVQLWVSAMSSTICPGGE